MDVEQLGSFRTRTADDGSLEIWAHGWRLESQLYALIPMGIAAAAGLALAGNDCRDRVLAPGDQRHA